mmetsp:Transcript_13175/g.28508  ORF Transcript_13175/g.28508 Transcript_13175/m.28508 type:complete len:280 (+) Transcript_13175:261-1100(+)
MLDKAEDAEDHRHPRHGVEHVHGGDALLDLLGPAEPVGDARFLVVARGAAGANGGDGARGVPGANGLEHHRKLQRPANAYAIHVHRRQNHHTALVLLLYLNVHELVCGVILQPTAVLHAPIDQFGIHSRVAHGILRALLAAEVLLSVAPEYELVDVVPPRRAHPVVLPVVLPDAHPPEGLTNDVCAADAAVQVVVGVGGAVPSVVRAEVVAVVLPVNPLAPASNPVVDVHLGGEVGPLPQRDGGHLELLLKVPADDVRGGRPQLVLDPIVRAGERPRHL